MENWFFPRSVVKRTVQCTQTQHGVINASLSIFIYVYVWNLLKHVFMVLLQYERLHAMCRLHYEHLHNNRKELQELTHRIQTLKMEIGKLKKKVRQLILTSSLSGLFEKLTGIWDFLFNNRSVIIDGTLLCNPPPPPPPKIRIRNVFPTEIRCLSLKSETLALIILALFLNATLIFFFPTG